MIKVINVLKDGTIIEDLTGHVVRRADCPGAYEVMQNMNRKEVSKNGRTELWDLQS